MVRAGLRCRIQESGYRIQGAGRIRQVVPPSDNFEGVFDTGYRIQGVG